MNVLAPSFLMATAMMAVFLVACLAILAITIRTHHRKSRLAGDIAHAFPIFDQLVQSIRDSDVSDEEIRQQVRPAYYPVFESYLRRRISRITPLDVSIERRIADVSGFTAFLIDRIGSTRRWNRALAIRTLSYLRDAKHLSLFQQIIDEDTFPQSLFAAGLGLALVGEPSSVAKVVEKLWAVTERHQEALLVILNAYGESIAPSALDALRSDAIENDEKVVIISFLAAIRYRDVLETATKMLRTESDADVLSSCLYAHRVMRSTAALPVIRPFLKDQRFEVRIEAVHALANTGGNAVIPEFIDKLRDQNWWVQRAAGEALAAMGKEGQASLAEIAEREDDPGAVAARSILADLRFNRLPAGAF